MVKLICVIYTISMLLRWGLSWQLVQYLMLGSLLLALSLIDLDTYQLPDPLVLAVALTALLRVAAEGMTAIVDGCVGALVIGVPLLLFVLLADYIVGRETMGGGDIKLLTALGFHFGAAQMLFLLLLSCCIGLAFAVGEFLAQKVRKSEQMHVQSKEMPFGPAIALAAWDTALFGETVVEWYVGLFF